MSEPANSSKLSDEPSSGWGIAVLKRYAPSGYKWWRETGHFSVYRRFETYEEAEAFLRARIEERPNRLNVEDEEHYAIEVRHFTYASLHELFELHQLK